MRKTRILAFVLTVVMLLSVLSLSAFAAYTPDAPSAVKTEVDALSNNAKFIASADFTGGTAAFVGGANSSIAKFNQYATTYPNMYYATDPVTGVKSLLLNKYPGTKNKSGEGGYRFIDGTHTNYDPTPNDTANDDVIASPDEGNNAFSLRTSASSSTRINLTENTVVVSTTMRFANFDNSFGLVVPCFYEYSKTENGAYKYANKSRTAIGVGADGVLKWSGASQGIALMQLTDDRAYTFTVVLKTKIADGIYDLYGDVYVDGVKVGADLPYSVVLKNPDKELPTLVYCFMNKMSGAVNVVNCDCTEKTLVTDVPAGYSDAEIGTNKFYMCKHDKHIGYVQSAYMYTLKNTYTATDIFTHSFLYNSGNTVEGYDLTVKGGTLGLNYYLNLTGDVLADENAKVVFTTPRGEVQEKLVKDVAAETNGSYKFTANVSSVEMAKDITMEIKSGEKVYKVFMNGVASDAYTYSVKEYADTVIASGATSENDKALAAAMLNYGAYAQKYFDYDAQNLPVATPDVSKVTDNDISAVTIAGTAPQGTKAALVLDSDITIVIYNAEGEKIGEEKGITSLNLDKSYTITCEGDKTVTVSVLAIGEKVLEKSANEDYKNLIKALKLFADASKPFAAQ